MLPPATSGPAVAISPFRPAWWLSGPHLQTIGGHLLRRGRWRWERRVELMADDGGRLRLDVGPEPPACRGSVLILHGLEGGSAAGYVREMSRSLHRHGIRAVAMNFRSCDGEGISTPRFYHAGETTDLCLALGWLAEDDPDRPRGAVGFSLGGNVLLRFLGAEGAGVGRLAAAAAVSVPFDLAGSVRCMERGPAALYGWRFLRSLRRKLRRHAGLLAGRCDLEGGLAARSLREFDDRVTAPLHGFEGASAYYASASCGPWLDRIRVPTLLIQAADDPFQPAELWSQTVRSGTDRLISTLVGTGGHGGFVGGRVPGQPFFWAEQEVAAFLAGRFGRTGAGVVGVDSSEREELA